MSTNVNFIAEISSNHSRSLIRCFEFIESAAKIGCSAVKFQLFKIDELFAENTLPETERERRRQWELPLEFLPEIASCCSRNEIQFSCTPFYLEAVEQLESYIDFFKIASYELLWSDLLIECAKTKKPIVLSTGMATEDEILKAVSTLRGNGCDKLTLLHCTSAYPTPINDANLAAIETLRNLTECDIGWSDHTVEPGVIYRAVHRWRATCVEFHYDLDGQGEEFGGGHCWLPDQIGKVILDINAGFGADGDGIKRPTPSEYIERLWRADPLDGLRPLISTRSK